MAIEKGRRWSRRRFLQQSGWAAGAAAAGLAGGPSCGEKTSSSRPPNIIFLLTDDQRWDTIGAAGAKVVQTPNIDRLAREGVLFRNNFVTTSICAVSRASIFTGLYARCHGIHDFATPLSEEQHAMSYPGRLREAGYRTGFIGKYGVGRELPAGKWDYFEGFGGQGQYLHQIGGRTVHLTSIMGDQALEFIDGCNESQPFHLSVSFKAPHVQDNVAPYFLNDPAYDDLYDGLTLEPFKKNDPRYFEQLPDFLKNTENRVRWERRFATPEKWQESVKRYYRLIYGVDAQIGRLLARLEERGFLNNTVVIFSSDNGFYLGERGFAGKWFMHEESIRTPLIICDPRLAESRSAVRDEMTLNIDICPTILALAGLEIPQSMNGRDLNPLAAGRSPRWRSEWFYEHLFDHERIPKTEGVRTAEWKYCRFLESDPLYEELYHLREDPGEEHNLAPSPAHQEQLERLRERRLAWIESLENWRPDRPWQDPA